jgi:transposase InsO family protein
MQLHNEGLTINHKTVERLMKEQGLKCLIRKKRYRSYKGTIGKIAPNILNRDFKADRPSQYCHNFSIFLQRVQHPRTKNELRVSLQRLAHVFQFFEGKDTDKPLKIQIKDQLFTI